MRATHALPRYTKGMVRPRQNRRVHGKPQEGQFSKSLSVLMESVRSAVLRNRRNTLVFVVGVVFVLSLSKCYCLVDGLHVSNSCVVYGAMSEGSPSDITTQSIQDDLADHLEVVNEGEESKDEDGEEEEAAQEVQEDPVAEPETVAPRSGRERTLESYFVNYGKRVVEIDREGSFKYLLLGIEDEQGTQASLVRGCPPKEGLKCKHLDILHRAEKDAEAKAGSYKLSVLGGGRITRHRSKSKSTKGYISVYGYSKTYGHCEECNAQAAKLVSESLGKSYKVKWSNEGYSESDEHKVKHEWVKLY